MRGSWVSSQALYLSSVCVIDDICYAINFHVFVTDGKFTPCTKETVGSIPAKLTELPPDQVRKLK